MQVEWYGQSAFRLTAADTTVAIDPFGDMSAMAASRGMQFDYPPIDGVEADLLLVTHEHIDHNGVEVDRRRPHDPALDGGQTGVADRRDHRDRLRARRGGGHRTRAEHDLRVRARRPACRSLRRLRPERAARRAGRGDRARRSADPPRRRRSDDRAPMGRRDRRAAAAALGRPDALPHPADRIPRDRGGVPRADEPTSSACRGRSSTRRNCPSRTSRSRSCRRRRSGPQRGYLALGLRDTWLLGTINTHAPRRKDDSDGA